MTDVWSGPWADFIPAAFIGFQFVVFSFGFMVGR